MREIQKIYVCLCNIRKYSHRSDESDEFRLMAYSNAFHLVTSIINDVILN